MSGRLGQWIEVGGVALSSTAGAGDVVSTREARAAGSVWIRVDEAP
ncbi:MAG: hypothetical protein RML56_13775 [Burkholderiales bacterium]|nr:hypothetical protein [Burkholderiales bacterium]